MKTVTVTWQGVELAVTGDYEPAERETRTEPGCGSDFCVDTIRYGGIAQGALQDSDACIEIGELALKACDNESPEYDE